MIHYHGTPITPREQLLRMAGRHFCVSFAEPRDAQACLQIGQSVMFDNGAFSAFTRGAEFDRLGYYRWLEGKLAHPHWAVIPDVIDGSADEQRTMRREWPFGGILGAPVWHLGLSIDYLLELADNYWRICFGSTKEYWQIRSVAWSRRMDEAFNALARRGAGLPWIHGLRMLGQAGQDWPLSSADSVNVGRNFKDVPNGCAECKAAPLDAIQSPTSWKVREEQMPLC